jgi:hypothetical protein
VDELRRGEEVLTGGGILTGRRNLERKEEFKQLWGVFCRLKELEQGERF